LPNLLIFSLSIFFRRMLSLPFGRDGKWLRIRYLRKVDWGGGEGGRAKRAHARAASPFFIAAFF
jgi:hypothetical protein